MNYWSDMSEQVSNILAEKPTVGDYANEELFSRWVRNLTPTSRGVICNARGLRRTEACAP